MSNLQLPVNSAKENGAYYTPHPVANLLVRYAARKKTDQLLDPACGDGRFIALHEDSVGVERDKLAADFASERAPSAEIHRSDFFSWASETSKRFDCAAGNPPFIRYQTFAGDVRKQALQTCRELGIKFSGLTSSWAPFLVVAASLLRPGGRMAFVVPAAIGHAPYATPLIEYLVGHFDSIRIVAIKERLFPRLSEDCWLLLADGFGGETKHIEFVSVDSLDDSLPSNPVTLVDVDEWRDAWNSRLRPYLLNARERAMYLDLARSNQSVRLGDIANIGIGYVTGANEFFHLTPSEARRWNIPEDYLQPTVRNGNALRNEVLSREMVDAWREADDPVLLLSIPKTEKLPASIKRYLESPRGLEARLAYKCRMRTPWYSVPDIRVPHFFLNYMSGETPRVVRNSAKASCTNAIHAVDVNSMRDRNRLVQCWDTIFTKLSCEVEGHPLGGGVLKLEPREAGRVVLHSQSDLRKHRESELLDALSNIRKWRHCE